MKHVEENMYFPSFPLPRKRHFTGRKKEEGTEKRWESSLSPFSGAIPSRSCIPPSLRGNTFLSNRFRSKRKCSSECFNPRTDNNSCNARNFLSFELLLLLLRETDFRVGTKRGEGKIKSPPIPCRHVAFISRLPRPLAGKYRNVRVTGPCQVITYFTASFLRWLATFWQPKYKGRRKI